MCEDMRAEIRRITTELCIPYVEIARQVSEQKGYPLSPSELSNALNGLNTPKSRRVLTDVLGYLTEQKMRQKSLLDIAKNV